ncbi:MAG: long-chain fatty aldehyde decarbonylase [Pseudomonadota bacterium]
MNRLMGLAVFGEATAARTYNMMSRLRPEFEKMLKKFAYMEGTHARWFRDACAASNVTPDKDFADGELGYLNDQVEAYYEAEDFDALAVVQGFIVESLAISTYAPFLTVADEYPGTRDAFERALEEEMYHVEWIKRYFRLRFYDDGPGFAELTRRVNVKGVDCVGGTMMNIADLLEEVGMSGADCAGAMMDNYAHLLEDVGIERKEAMREVTRMFAPLIQRYRAKASATT